MYLLTSRKNHCCREKGSDAHLAQLQVHRPALYTDIDLSRNTNFLLLLGWRRSRAWSAPLTHHKHLCSACTRRAGSSFAFLTCSLGPAPLSGSWCLFGISLMTCVAFICIFYLVVTEAAQEPSMMVPDLGGCLAR